MPFTLFPSVLRGLFVATIVVLFTAPVQARQFDKSGYSFSTEPLPGWVDWADLAEVPGQRPGLAAAYRLVDHQVYISESGETRFSRMVTQPLTEAGLNQAAEIEINFNPAYQTLTLHKLDLVRDGQLTNKLQPEQVRLIQREQDFDKRLYDGVVTAVIIVNDVRLKDSVDLAYSIEGRNPVFGNKYFSAFSLGWNVPVDRARVRVSAPAERKLYTRSLNTDLEPVIRRHNGRIEYEWSQENTPAIISEDAVPSWHQPYPGVQISEYRRWRDVTRWANSLYKHDDALPASLVEILQQWRDEEPDKKQLTARALKLVQNEVRYFGIELGQNSHRPSPPGEVYERRYGDCKDKATLLVTILDQLGIKAYPALVSTEYQRDVDNWLPSPGLFDHVIVTTELDGKRYWLDGTSNYQQGSIDTLGVPDFERALIIRKGENRLAKIEVANSAASSIDVEEAFLTSSYSTPVSLSVTTTYRGTVAESMREYFATNTPAEIARAFMNYYAKIYPSISLDNDITASNDTTDNRLTVVEHYHIDDFWKADNENRIAYVIGSSIAPYIKKPDTIRRTAPLAISYPVNVRHQSTIIYPEDIDYENREPSVAVKGKFIDYRRAINYADRKLTVTHHYSSRKEVVMPGQLDSYYSAINQVRNTLEYTTQLNNITPKGSINAKINTLLDRLNTISTN
ncbi:uncharacterized protein DUF3857 [Thiogranum longum]|uniref:Uncharacterized protein DUF3857 n=1 Tax=Thiogranum longum TaxID=1537524 RepID=A0A4R1HCJ5_9GAMM|nr:DUF3857 domain-containing transglutaminase family protein [Thiogranum longum]TCK18273.1 uncharacterized protein DUF3857 [Thiogranum longum]